MQIITSLPPPDSGADLSFHSLKEQLDLLNTVWLLFFSHIRALVVIRSKQITLLCFDCFQLLNAGDDVVGLEQLEEDTDGMALLKARRSMGSMRAMSGANGMIYMEYRYAN